MIIPSKETGNNKGIETLKIKNLEFLVSKIELF